MRVSLKNLNKVPWYLKPFFWNQKRKYGKMLEPALVWASVPKLFIAVSILYGVIDRKKSPLSPELRSLITVWVSQINGCRFCVDINSALLIKRAGSQAKYDELNDWRQSNVLSSGEKAALAYAEKMTITGETPDEACFQELKKYFTEETIIELTALIAFQNMSSKFNSALDIDSQGFCKIPPKEQKK